jgi:hypothetical protein
VLRHLPIWIAQIRRYVVSQSGARDAENKWASGEKTDGERFLQTLIIAGVSAATLVVVAVLVAMTLRHIPPIGQMEEQPEMTSAS